MVILVSGMMCFAGVTSALAEYHVYSTLAEYEKATGKTIEKFSEAPMLKTKVAAGLLPPVEERLPEEFCVIEPEEEIGQYGGVLFQDIPSTPEVAAGDPGHLIRLDPKNNLIFWAAKGWEISKDYRDITIYLRKGLRWSDGAPFTADDIVFWYEDIMLNKDLTPVLLYDWRATGEPLEVKKIDDYTVRIHSGVSYYGIKFVIGKDALAITHYAPKHYLKKWHIKYNPEANELAKEEGFEYWWQAFQFRNKPLRMGGGGTQANPEMPTLGPFKLIERTSVRMVLERNPYFWAVDTAGNQLPYIDRTFDSFESGEIALMKVISGDTDYAITEVTELPLLLENVEQGDYRVNIILGGELAWPSLTFNLTIEDPVWRKIFRDIRFRRAMSLAVDREEINQATYVGLAKPSQVTCRDINSLYQERWARAYAEYDPQRANMLLDEIGLKWDKDHKWRLRPDGKPLTILLETMEWNMPYCELLPAQWEKIGVKLLLKTLEWGLYVERAQSNQGHLFAWTIHADNTDKFFPGGLAIPDGNDTPWGLLWTQWYDSGGEKGEEPPDWAKEFFEFREKWAKSKNEEEYLRWGTKLYDWFAEYLPVIGSLGYTPLVCVAKNDLRNVWKFNIGYFSVELQKPQWFFKK